MLLWLAAACAPQPDLPPTWADVQPLIAERCTGCHQDGGIGGFSLQTYGDVAPWLEPVAVAVAAGDMPPWDAEPVRPYLDDPSLTDAEIALLLEWIDAGAPRGTESVEPLPPPVADHIPSVDVELWMPEPFTPNETSVGDEYRCFALPWPDDADPWITAVEVEPGNLTSVHHVVVFVVPPHLAEVVDGFDAGDGRPGYPCFGGAEMDGYEPANLTETFVQSLVGQWAPGANPIIHRETGLPVDPGSRVVLQMHYHPTVGDPTDLSGVQFSTATEVERIGASVGWLDMTWILSPDTMHIPADAEGVEHSFRGPLTMAPGISAMAPDLDLDAPVRIDTVMPHMHLLGRSIEVLRHRGDEIEPIVSIPAYDFDWQRIYVPTDPVEVLPTDELEVHCTFDNTLEKRRQTGAPLESADVGWGEGTLDEMCVAVLTVSQ